MKTSSIALAFALLASTGLVAQASAGEGNGDPFPLTTHGVSTTLTAGTVGSLQNPFPYTAAGRRVTLGNTPDTGSEQEFEAVETPYQAPVQTRHGPQQ